VSAEADRLPGHSLLLADGIRSDLLVLSLDRAGFAVAAGSACASGDSEPSHVLLAQGMTADQARSVIRVSIGIDTTEAEVDAFAAAVGQCVECGRDPRRGVEANDLVLRFGSGGAGHALT